MGTLALLGMVAMVVSGVVLMALVRWEDGSLRYLMAVLGVGMSWVGVFALAVSTGQPVGEASVMGVGVVVGANLLFRSW